MDELSRLRQAAIHYLSRREHSRWQLRQKLQQKGAEPEHITAVLNWCEQQGYLNEQRFIEMLLRQRSNQGYGYQVVLAECRQQQLTATQLDAAITALEIDWWQVAQRCYQKKFGDTQATDYPEKMKRMAYLQRRGFSQEQIRAVFSQSD